MGPFHKRRGKQWGRKSRKEMLGTAAPSCHTLGKQQSYLSEANPAAGRLMQTGTDTGREVSSWTHIGTVSCSCSTAGRLNDFAHAILVNRSRDQQLLLSEQRLFCRNIQSTVPAVDEIFSAAK
ncbi:hypothetical protein TGP89_238860 [Toxoplasma gondii p89]|uniref:Uncharacterized protein n=2 Tax=Toxoplasma gondii TaxID=5811 RepID=A0A2T6INU9_TOXGO|nr:hypothetical protein TGP89_238860 [Toxoplasma gondii p89]PUA87017.1 hypothetical protein TGBR9_238860 [Toxoplasma gondii TgCATBr9]